MLNKKKRRKKKKGTVNTENTVITEGSVNRPFPANKNAIKTQIGMKKK